MKKKEEEKPPHPLALSPMPQVEGTPCGIIKVEGIGTISVTKLSPEDVLIKLHKENATPQHKNIFVQNDVGAIVPLVW